MPEIITCPSCSRKLQAPEAILGQDVQCPTCGATFTARFGASKVRADAPPEPPRSAAPRERFADDYGLDEERGGPDGWRSLPPRADRPRRDMLPHRGPAVLTLGILALVGLVVRIPALVLGPIAWAMGNNDLALIRAGRMDRGGEGMTSGGQTCGLIATILGAIGVVLACLNGLGDHGLFGRRGW